MNDYQITDEQRYDAKLLKQAASLTEGRGDGRISYNDARLLLKTVQDAGSKRDTLAYLLERYKWTDKARAFILEQAGLEGHEAAAQARPYFETALELHYQARYDAGRSGEADTAPFWRYYQLNKRELGYPDEVQQAVGFYESNIEQQDWGIVRLYYVPESALPFAGLCGGLFAVLATADGEDGWVELYDAEGNTLGYGRCWMELVCWGGKDELRAQVRDGALPPELQERKGESLWGKAPA